MLKLQRPPVTSPGGYATAADFCRIFKGEMKRLYLLAFLLTANHVKAESCFLAAFADAGKTAGVFREFASSWSRRAIIAHAIRLMTPVSSHASETSDLWDETNREVATEVINRVVQMGLLERFVYVLTVLERYGDGKCAALLSCSRAHVAEARVRALEQLWSRIDRYGRVCHLLQPLCVQSIDQRVS